MKFFVLLLFLAGCEGGVSIFGGNEAEGVWKHHVISDDAGVRVSTTLTINHDRNFTITEEITRAGTGKTVFPVNYQKVTVRYRGWVNEHREDFITLDIGQRDIRLNGKSYVIQGEPTGFWSLVHRDHYIQLSVQVEEDDLLSVSHQGSRFFQPMYSFLFAETTSLLFTGD